LLGFKRATVTVLFLAKKHKRRHLLYGLEKIETSADEKNSQT
jgi:hypothetical protein